MNNHDVARVFDRIGDLLEVKGENAFRVNAYREAARQLRAVPEKVEDLARAKRLEEIQGVGPAISEKIQELLRTGKLAYYDELRREVPETLVELLQIPGLGPRTAQLLHREIGVTSLVDLRVAVAVGRLAEVPGMGEKTQQKIARELERFEQRNRRMPIGTALPAAEQVLAMLRQSCRAIDNAEVTGSIRRRRDTIGDIDFVASATDVAAVLDCFTSLPLVRETAWRGDVKATILTQDNLQMDLLVVQPHEWGSALQHFTGSKAHNIKLRDLAIERGWRVNEYGIVDVKTGRRLGGENEEDLYRLLGIPMMPPEIREDTGEVEAALADDLPVLVTAADIRGELHCHSDWSDGGTTIEGMVEAARRRGLDYLALTDHSRSLGVAGGLTIERLREQRRVVDRVNRDAAGFRLLAGIELEILPNGSLDFPDEVLAELDVVIASVHSRFSQSREEMTRRIVAAVRNPHVDVIGHLTGRLLGRREGYQVDVDAVQDACEETGTALEINANPARLDVDDDVARRARARGIPVPINTDAHAPDNFDLFRYGIATARRGWLGPGDVLNTRTLDDLLAWLHRRG